MKRYIAIYAMLTALPVSAQLDNTVEVTNEVKPVVTDVKKVDVKTQAAETKVKHYTMEYAVNGQRLTTYVAEPLSDYRSEAVWKGNKRGYLHLAGGNVGNLDGQLGYQFDFSDANALGIDLSLQGFNGKAKDNAHYAIYDWKSRDYRNRAALKFSHAFGNGSEFYAKGAFENRMFNYMGYFPTLDINAPATDVDALTDKQHNVLGKFEVGLTPYTTGKFTLNASAGVDFFSQKYMTNLSDKLGETFFHANAGIAYEAADNHSIGLGLEFVSSDYGDVEIDGITRLRLTPHYIYNDDNMQLQLGVFVNTKGEVAPDVRFAYHISRNSDVYVEARGYEDDNNLRRLSGIHPYFVLDALANGEKKELEAEFHQIDARLGYRFKTNSGFSGNINGGFDYSKNAADIDALYGTADKPILYPWIDFSRNRRFYANADFAYAYKGIVKIDAKNALSMESGEHIDKWISGSYIVPAFEMKWSADVRIVRGLYFGLNWEFATYTTPDLPLDGVLYDRPNTANLGANLRYTLPIDMPLTLFVKGDNLLNQKYDRYFGYHYIGANFLAGIAMSF